MFATRRLLHSCRITLFTRDNCGLCSNAKAVLSDVWDKRPFAYQEINLAKPESESWKDLYDFDIPVIHVSSSQAPEEQVSSSHQAIKLMHRFTVEQVETQMDKAEKS